jgi:hypothetical protein
MSEAVSRKQRRDFLNKSTVQKTAVQNFVVIAKTSITNFKVVSLAAISVEISVA